jgi:hypothetical protein
MAREMIDAKNILHPGKTYRMEAYRFGKACAGLLSVLPRTSPGMTQSEMLAALRTAVSDTDFPGSTHGWWGKAAQLHLEAEGQIVREICKPVRWRLAE